MSASKTKRTKKLSPAAVAPAPWEHDTTIVGPVVRADGHRYMHQADLHRYEAARLRYEAALKDVGISDGVAAKLRADFDRVKRDTEESLRRNGAERLALESRAKGFEDQFRTLRAAYSHAYNVDMDKVSYDDETGLLHVTA